MCTFGFCFFLSLSLLHTLASLEVPGNPWNQFSGLEQTKEEQYIGHGDIVPCSAPYSIMMMDEEAVS